MGLFGGKPECDLEFQIRMKKLIGDLVDEGVNEISQDTIDKQHLRDVREKARGAIELYIKKCGKIEDKGIAYHRPDKALTALFDDRFQKRIENEDVKRNLDNDSDE